MRRSNRIVWHSLLVAALSSALIATAVAPAGGTFSGENGPILYREDNFNGSGAPLLTVEPDGSGVTELSQRPGLFSDWRADGKRIAFDFFERDGDQQIATMAPNGRDLRVITSGPGIHEVPSWSPSGKRIVFDFSADDPNASDFQTNLWTMRADGSDARPLPMSSKGFDVEPRYAPNGKSIAFMRLRFTEDGDFRQAVFNVSTTGRHEVRRLTPWRLGAEHPTWSPDSRLIIFNTPIGTIQSVRPDGGGRSTLLPAEKGFGGHKPWFSPDGSSVLFMCENQGTLNRPPDDYNQDICIASTDGSDIVKVVDTPKVQENWPSWGPAAGGN